MRILEFCLIRCFEFCLFIRNSVGNYSEIEIKQERNCFRPGMLWLICSRHNTGAGYGVTSPAGTDMKGRNAGFTMIELVTVIILIGILAVSVASKMINLNSDRDEGYLHEFETRVRLVQEINMNRADGSCVAAVISNSGFWHQEVPDCSTDQIVANSAGRLSVNEFDGTFNVESSSDKKRVVIFDGLGSVHFCGEGAAAADVTISPSKKECKINFGQNGHGIEIGAEGHITLF